MRSARFISMIVLAAAVPVPAPRRVNNWAPPTTPRARDE